MKNHLLYTGSGQLENGTKSYKNKIPTLKISFKKVINAKNFFITIQTQEKTDRIKLL